MKHRSKALSAILTLSIALTPFTSIPVIAIEPTQEDTSENRYVILTENAVATQRVIKPNDVELVKPSLNKPDIIVATLTQNEASAIESEYQTMAIETDIVFRADSIGNEQQQKPENQYNQSCSTLLWNHQMINAGDFSEPTSNAKIRVGVMDSGINSATSLPVAYHQEIVNEDSFIFPDLSGHGTAVAGIINSDKYGITNSAELYSIKIMNSNNIATLSDVVEGIYWAIDNDIKILNMSFGTSQYSEVLHTAITEAQNAGILIVASTGNDGSLRYPAAFSGVIAAGSLDHNGNAIEADRQYTELLYAPGEQISTVGDFQSESIYSGTSMAAPHITAAAAALWKINPEKSAQFIEYLLFASANISLTDIAVLDVGFAIENYASIEAGYTGSVSAPAVINNSELKTFDDAIFEALWNKDSHASTVPTEIDEDSFKPMTTNQLSLLKVFSSIPDHTLINFTSLNSGVSYAQGGNTYQFTNYFSGVDNVSLYDNTNFTINNNTSVDFGDYKLLHGRQNYITSLKFLYTVSKKLWDVDYYKNESLSRANIIRNAIQASVPKNMVGFYGDTKSYGLANATFNSSGKITGIAYTYERSAYQQFVALQKLIYLAAACKCNALSLTYPTTPAHYNFQKEAAIKILGLALHLAGDVYAHRTVMPTKQTDGTCKITFNSNATTNKNMNMTIYQKYTSSSSTINIFGNSFWSGTHGIKSVILGNGTIPGGAKITTRQINLFWQEASGSQDGTYYEDNRNFMPTRYNFSVETVKALVNMFYDVDNTPFTTDIFKVADYNPNISGVKTQRIADLRRYISFIDASAVSGAYLKYYDSKVTVSDVFGEGKAPTSNSDAAWFTLNYQHSY